MEDFFFISVMIEYYCYGNFCLSSLVKYDLFNDLEEGQDNLAVAQYDVAFKNLPISHVCGPFRLLRWVRANALMCNITDDALHNSLFEKGGLW